MHGAAAAIRQILDVLIGDALWHGEGAVAMTGQGLDELVADILVILNEQDV